MGNGVFSRRQRKIFQSLLAVTIIFGMIYGGMVSYEMHKQLKRTEALALKYQQHQESLSAQLQGKHVQTYEGFPTAPVYVLCSVRMRVWSVRLVGNLGYVGYQNLTLTS